MERGDVMSGIAMKLSKRSFAVLILLGLSACGTTYSVPEANDAQAQRAEALFAQERNAATAQAGARLSTSQSVNQFIKVANRVEPVAEQICRQEAAKAGTSVNCDLKILVDEKMPFKNAYQKYDGGTPIIAFTVPMIMDARNEDEIAFVMGHEAGHHIAKHIQKTQQQQAAGALILGMAAAYASANDPYATQYQRQRTIDDAVELGTAIGGAAFSQTYELEADVIGTHVASAAGYDPVRGARFFARPEHAKLPNGQLSFWGTHPPDKKRVATVIATADRIEHTHSTELVAKAK